MALGNLEDLFLHLLKDTYDAEKRLLRALPKMAKASSSEELAAAFQEHKKVTEKQVDRLEKVFGVIKKPARGKKCEGMAGLVEEGKEEATHHQMLVGNETRRRADQVKE